MTNGCTASAYRIGATAGRAALIRWAHTSRIGCGGCDCMRKTATYHSASIVKQSPRSVYRSLSSPRRLRARLSPWAYSHVMTNNSWLAIIIVIIQCWIQGAKGAAAATPIDSNFFPFPV